jgi:hypothetical protein
MEREVLAAAQAKLDADRILEALEVKTTDKSKKEHPLAENGSLFKLPNRWREETGLMRPWKIALAASLLGSTATLVFSGNNLMLSAAVGAAIFLVALADPIDDQSLAGAAARVVGRAALRSVEASQPKVKAVARAVVTGQDELVALKQRVLDLEAENAELRKWKAMRIKAEDRLAEYSLPTLKNLARGQNLPVGGTKLQLLMRLVDARVIEL